jgi:pimeloyl-ACP methyl ester carboxylesterase
VWELVRPRLERRFERVLAPALPGHLGGPPLPSRITPTTMVDAIERVLDAEGIDVAVVAGNSLGGYVALQLAARGRAAAVTAFAPAGGWDARAGKQETLAMFPELLLPGQAIASMVEDASHLTEALVSRILTAALACREAPRMLAFAAENDWPLDPPRCPVRFVWGTEDKLLPWPSAAARYQREFAHAEWVVLDGVGHCPQLELPLEAAELVTGG